MIGSHNTMSYLKPVHWYHRILSRWSKCQTLTIYQQYKLGVKYFDIRIRKINGCYHFVHNKVDYGKVDNKVIDFLSRINARIRLILDIRKEPNNDIKEKNDFYEYIAFLHKKGVVIDRAITFWNWKTIYERCGLTKLVEEDHASVKLETEHYILQGLKPYAKLVNPNYSFNDNSNIVYLLDFVEYVGR